MDMAKKYIVAVCLDCGDTIVDEGTEVKDDDGVVLTAALIPGASEMVHGIKARGYPLALVADGPVGSFHNTLTQHNLYDAFDVMAISAEVGVDKPDARMFDHALAQLRISKEEYGRVVMVGNNLSRDVKGANELGLISIWLDWAPRRPKIPADATETPDYTIKTPDALLDLLDQIEKEHTSHGAD